MSKREWIVVCVLLALVATIGLPYVQMRREQARRNTCDFSQAELAQALFRAHELQTALPGYREAETFANATEPQAVAWTFILLPYLGLSATEQELVDQQFSAQRRGKYLVVQEHWLAGQKSSDTQELWIKPLCCPAVQLNAEHPAYIQFVANCGLPDAPATETAPADWPANGVFQDRFTTSAPSAAIAQPLSLEEVEARDGRGSTLLFTENIDAGEWTQSEESRIGFVWLAQARDGQLQRDPQLLGINQRRGEGDGSLAFARPASYHRGGVNVVFADGHTQFINQRLDDEILIRFMTVDDTQLRLPGSEDLFPPEFRREPVTE
jgi:prepilin-type processing-associated H-X9-DG protein